jgi:hypothetical protein
MLQTMVASLVDKVDIQMSLMCLVAEFLGKDTSTTAGTKAKKAEGARGNHGRQPTQNPSIPPICQPCVNKLNRLYPTMGIVTFCKRGRGPSPHPTIARALAWASLLGPNLTRQEYMGYSKCAVLSPMDICLTGCEVVGLLFSAHWCTTCTEFTPILDQLYTSQRALGADKLEVVLVPRCRDAKSTKYYSLGMPWLSMCHKADDKIRM